MVGKTCQSSMFNFSFPPNSWKRIRGGRGENSLKYLLPLILKYLQEEEEAAAPQAVQTSFTVKLMKYDPAKKVAIIKAVKSLIDGMNLVQAKKFVEEAPAVLKADIAKDEAEKIKEVLESVGAETSIE